MCGIWGRGQNDLFEFNRWEVTYFQLIPNLQSRFGHPWYIQHIKVVDWTIYTEKKHLKAQFFSIPETDFRRKKGSTDFSPSYIQHTKYQKHPHQSILTLIWATLLLIFLSSSLRSFSSSLVLLLLSELLDVADPLEVDMSAGPDWGDDFFLGLLSTESACWKITAAARDLNSEENSRQKETSNEHQSYRIQ